MRNIKKELEKKIKEAKAGNSEKLNNNMMELNKSQFSNDTIKQILDFNKKLEFQYRPLLKKGADKAYLQEEILEHANKLVENYKNKVWAEKDKADILLKTAEKKYKAKMSTDTNLLQYYRKQDEIKNMSENELLHVASQLMDNNDFYVDSDRYNIIQNELKSRGREKILDSFREKTKENKKNEFWRAETPEGLEASEIQKYFKDNTGDTVRIVDSENRTQNLDITEFFDFSFLDE